MSQPLTHSAPFSWYHLRLADLFNLGSFALKSKNGLMKIPQYLNLGTSPKDLTWLHHVASILQLGGCLILNFEELKTRSLGSPSFFTFAFCLFSPICFANCALYSSLFYLAPCIKPRECISSGWCQFCKMMFDRGINGWRFFLQELLTIAPSQQIFIKPCLLAAKLGAPMKLHPAWPSRQAKPSAAGWETNNG